MMKKRMNSSSFKLKNMAYIPEEFKDHKKVIILSNSAQENDKHYAEEFCYLLAQAFFYPVLYLSQKVEEINSATYMGKGKIEDTRIIVGEWNKTASESNQIEYVACNFDLTALQQRNIEKITGLKVIDRTSVILKIFELNAKTREAKLQVEIAKLQYLRSHLINNKASYSQVTSGGGAHNKGEGEKQIELDRRKIDGMITFKKNELSAIKLSRRNMRTKRSNSPIPKIAVVGYTNAGKSTLMNCLLERANHNCKKNVYVEDELFATLETSTRVIETNKYPTFILTDTVGFISKLPTYLVDAFRSTLEEIKEADLIIQVVDYSDPFHEDQIATTNKVLEDLGCENIPMIYLLNKFDLLVNNSPRLAKKNELFTSLIDKNDIDDVLKFISKAISASWEKKKIVVPFICDFTSFKRDNYVQSFKETEEGYDCTCYINPKTKHKYGFIK